VEIEKSLNYSELDKYLKNDFLVVGMGNEMRGDDGVGLYIVKGSQKNFPHKFLDVGMTIENYIFKIIEYPEKVILLIDNVDFGERIGSIKLIDSSKLREQGISTHSLSLNKIIMILKEAGKEVLLLGIQGKNLNIGENISREVKESADDLVKYFIKRLSEK